MINQSALDRSVLNVLIMKIASGLFEDSMTPDTPLDLDTPYDRQLSREAAQQGIVMAINKGNTLPLKADPKMKVSIAS